MDKKYLLGVAVAAALGSGSAMAGPSVNFYGNVDASIVHNDEDPGTGTSMDVESYDTKIGITGGDKINDSLRAFYRAEFGFRMTDGEANFDGGERGSKEVERYVGLACNTAGKIRIGQIASIYDDAVDATDIFVNIHATNQYATTRRQISNNTVRWDSNEIIPGLTASASFTADGGTAPTPAAAIDTDEEVDQYQAGVNYSLGDNLTINYAYVNTRAEGGPSSHANAIAISTSLGPVQLGANFERTSSSTATNTNRVFVSAAMKANDKLTLALGVGRGNNEESRDDEKDSLVLGAHYALSDKTTGYAEYTSFSDTAAGADSSTNKRWVNIGVKHSFGNPRR